MRTRKHEIKVRLSDEELADLDAKVKDSLLCRESRRHCSGFGNLQSQCLHPDAQRKFPHIADRQAYDDAQGQVPGLDGKAGSPLRVWGRRETAIMDGYRLDGKPKVKYFYGKTQKEVKGKVRAWETNRASGIDASSDFTFRQWSDIWYEGHRDNVTPTTQESYKYTLQILQDFFGPRKISEVKPYDVEEFLKKLRRDGRSDSYLAGCRGMLYQIFHKAEANDLVRKNPGSLRRKDALHRPQRP